MTNKNWTSYDEKMLHELDSFFKEMTNKGPDGLVRLAEFFAAAKDYDNAIKLMERAAELGSHYAYFWLGWMYSLTEIGYYDTRESFEWFYSGARTGSVYCMYLLALWFHDGVGCMPDEEKSAEWLGKALNLDPKSERLEEMKSLFEGCAEPDLSSIDQ